MNKLLTGTRSNLPPEVMQFIDDGLSPIAALRKWKRYSLADLARIAGVSEEHLEVAEKGGGLILQERVALAKSFGVTSELFPVRDIEAENRSREPTSRADEAGRKEMDRSPPAEGELGRKSIDQP